MITRLSDIHLRRAQLVALAAAQRTDVILSVQPLVQPLHVADTTLVCLRYLKTRPLILVAMLAGMTAIILSRNSANSWPLKRLAFRAFALWRSYRSLGVWVTRGRSVWLRIGTAWHNRRRHSPHDSLIHLPATLRPSLAPNSRSISTK